MHRRVPPTTAILLSLLSVTLPPAHANPPATTAPTSSVITHRPALTLDFVPQSLAVSEDGTLAAFLAPGGDRGNRPPGADSVPAQLAVVDLKALKVVARRPFPMNVQEIAVDADHVYLPLQDADALIVLSTRDLSETRRVFTPRRVTSVRPAGKYLFAATQNGPTFWYRTTDFTTVDPLPDPGDRTPFDSSTSGSPALPLDLGTGARVYDGLVYDASFGHALAAMSPGGMLNLQGRAAPVFSDRNVPPLARWGAWAQFNMVFRLGGHPIGDYQGAAATPGPR